MLPSGQLAWYRVSARAVAHDAAGRALRVIATWADVSRERRLQAQLVFSDRLASIGTLAAGVAHEINNPLSYLLANFEFLEERLADGRAAAQDGEALAAVREARDGARRIAEIVRGLRTFSRRDGEAPPVESRRARPVRAAARIADSQLRSGPRCSSICATCPRCTAASTSWPRWSLNLLVNAAQAIPEGRRPRHTSRRPPGSPGTGAVALEVTDTGSGIAPEQLPRIFDPFFTTKPVGEGSGLGLAVCHGIVEALGGAIEVESTLGAGELLPRAPADRTRASRRPRRRQRSRWPASAAACSCSTTSRWCAGRWRGRSRAITRWWRSPIPRRRSARLARGERFDLVVCDLMMPGLTGMECHEALRTSRPELARSMIFLTGGAFTAKARAFLDHVPNVRVDKPFDGRRAARGGGARGGPHRGGLRIAVKRPEGCCRGAARREQTRGG